MREEDWKEDPEYWELKRETEEDRERFKDSQRAPWDRLFDGSEDADAEEEEEQSE